MDNRQEAQRIVKKVEAGEEVRGFLMMEVVGRTQKVYRHYDHPICEGDRLQYTLDILNAWNEEVAEEDAKLAEDIAQMRAQFEAKLEAKKRSELLEKVFATLPEWAGL